MSISSFSFKIHRNCFPEHEYYVHLSTMPMGLWSREDYGVYGSYDIPALAKDWPSHWPYKPIDRAINKIFLEEKQLHLKGNYLEYDTKENVNAILKDLKEKIANKQINASINTSSAELYLFISSVSNTTLE